MRESIPEDWLHPSSIARARQVQAELAAMVRTEDDIPGASSVTGLPPLVAGADSSFAFRVPDAPLHAGIVLLRTPELRPVGAAGATRPSEFPYVPGFLGFREVPVLLDALRKLPNMPGGGAPGLVLLDGHGLAHPRGFGIACHLGVLLDVPAIGVAKSILVGQVEGTLGPEAGSRAPLVWQNRTVGMALRTRVRANPVFVSVGHRVSLDTAVRLVMLMVRGYRLPEPTRHAHEESNRQRRAADTPGPGAATAPR